MSRPRRRRPDLGSLDDDAAELRHFFSEQESADITRVIRGLEWERPAHIRAERVATASRELRAALAEWHPVWWANGALGDDGFQAMLARLEQHASTYATHLKPARGHRDPQRLDAMGLVATCLPWHVVNLTMRGPKSDAVFRIVLRHCDRLAGRPPREYVQFNKIRARLRRELSDAFTLHQQILNNWKKTPLK